MLTKEKQKAIIEAMLFVSTQPLPIKKMVKKLRSVIRQQQKEALEAQENTEAENADAENIEAENTVEDAQSLPGALDGEELADVIDMMAHDSEAENDNQASDEEVVELEAQDAEPKENTEDYDEAQENLNQESDEDNEEILQASDDELADEQPEEEEGDDDSDDDSDVMAQLMQKQQELDEELTAADVKTLLREMEEDLQNDQRGLELVVVARGYQLRTKYDVSLYLKDEKVRQPQRFSPSSLETLAIVAYQQPVTRNKVEEIRGVDSGGVLKTLLDKGILKVVGRSDEPGKPLIYGTSKRFLEVFGLQNLRDLPSLQDYHGLQMSQDKDELDEQIHPETDATEIRVDDLLDNDISELTEAEQAVLDDLDESLKGLKEVEREVMDSAEPKPEAPEVEEEVLASEEPTSTEAEPSETEQPTP